MSPVRYELGFHIPEDGILHSHRRENPTSYELKVALKLFYQQEARKMTCNKIPKYNNMM
jgi:hypothetical protein